MHGHPQPRSGGRMAATDDTPWVSVSLLAEHTFCPRAGVIQHESREEDTGEEKFHAPRGKAFYTIKQIEKELTKWGNYTLIMLVITLFSFVCVVPIFILLWCFLRWADIYYSHYLPAKNARASVPNPEHTEPQPTNWWALIQAGFEPRRLDEGLRDPRWRLVGCPWRILVKGDLRIPVFRKRLGRGDSGDKLYRQHYARMAAYCHLIQECEGASSPYGIVLFGHTYTGMTVPATPWTNKTFHDALVATREMVASLPGKVPPAPSVQDRGKCKLCPHSWRDRTTGLSVCGQRFNWVPPNIRDF